MFRRSRRCILEICLSTSPCRGSVKDGDSSMRPRYAHRVVAAVLVCFFSVSAIAQTWVGPAGGSWSEADNWNPQVVPNNAPPTTYYTPTINVTGPVVDGGFSIAGLNLDGQISLNEGSSLGFQSGGGNSAINGSGT